MSDFARGVVGVFAVGMIAGVGALMLIPQSSPSAMRFAEPPAPPCNQQTWPATDRICQKWTAPRHGEAHGAAGTPAPLVNARPAAQSEPTAAGQEAAAVGEKPSAIASATWLAQNARAAPRHKAEGLQAVRRFGDDLSDLRASAYAPDGTRRTTTGRPGSRQDTHNYGVRGRGAGAAQGNGFFLLFR
jgi:hypothetical protein